MGAMSSVPRLFVDAPLQAGVNVPLDEKPGKYLTRVMRLGEGDTVRVFNGKDGEWQSRLQLKGAKHVELCPVKRTRVQYFAPDFSLFFAPLKKTQTDFVVEKACELGVRKIVPIITEFTQASRVRTDRLQATVIEAAEQTERLDIPRVCEDFPLSQIAEGWDPSSNLFFCDEAGDAEPMATVLLRQKNLPQEVLNTFPHEPAGLLIGPEGGFSPRERDWLRSLSFIVPVTLGPRILRAETAAVAALTLWQSLVGDWRNDPYLAEISNG